MAVTAEIIHTPKGYHARCSCGVATTPTDSADQARAALFTHWANHTNHN